MCYCQSGYTGDPFLRCSIIVVTEPPARIDPCRSGICGLYGECRVANDRAICTCKSGYFGTPPNCRPECTINQDCPNDRVCINNKCTDSCAGNAACGYQAYCRVINHVTNCFCNEGYVGDPFTACKPKPVEPEVKKDPCYPNQCGTNAICEERGGVAVCKCIPEHFGDPHVICRPECILNTDCPNDKACYRQKCKNPCTQGTCGANSLCSVRNHVPVCTCLPDYTGEPFRSCFRIPPPQPKDPCSPSPCGLNSQCKVINGVPTCSCLPNYSGSPPNCAPECVVNSQCPLDKTCESMRCVKWVWVFPSISKIALQKTFLLK